MRHRGFTLIELLVVVAIIITLLAILMPSMGRAIEASNRAVCASNQRQISLHAINFATDNLGVLPGTTRKQVNVDHLHWVGIGAWLKFTVGIENSDVPVRRDLAILPVRPGEEHLFCPNRMNGWKIEDRGRWGMRFGYMVMFGRHRRPINNGNPSLGIERFESTLRVSDSNTDGVMTADVNEEGTAVPVIRHTSHTVSGETYVTGGILNPLNAMDEIGSEGANVGYLDGSVRWKFTPDMKRYYTKTSSNQNLNPGIIGWW